MARLSLWPQSLFGRLVAASAIAVLLAQTAGLVLIARERERFILQGNVREWSRRIAEITFMLQPLNAQERAAATTRLIEQSWRFSRQPHEGELFHQRPLEPGFGPTPAMYVPLPLAPDFEPAFEQQLHTVLGTTYRVSVTPTADASRRAIPISAPFSLEGREGSAQPYDVTVHFPIGDAAVFRVTRMPRGALLPRNLLVNLTMLVGIMGIALFVTARSITRPLSELARAADGVGRDLRQPKLQEKGARELRDAARAFNTMQDRLHRYLDSRTRVLAAMSHDLKTPLTRLRLQVETLNDPAIQARFGKQLDEMESMVRGALALFRGLDDDEVLAPIDMNALLATLQSEFIQMGASVTVEGKALNELFGKPQALKRCLTNLIDNAIKFGKRATVLVEEGAAIMIRVRDEGPGVPPDELERLFEPFYRLESSRNRDTGGTGLGLSIARDVAQAHGGSLVLRNLAERGLEAVLILPLRR
jgi:signal transduction histidine kinase